MSPHPGTLIQVAHEQRVAAETLAAMIEHDMTGLTPEERCDLRLLPMLLLRWADAIDPDRAPYDEPEMGKNVVTIQRAAHV